MKIGSQEVGVLGIWGKGGMGKTTLARAIFDQFSHQFDSSYFVSNVREESKKIGLTCLLEKTISVLLNDGNLTMIESPNTQRRLRRIRALLVLDDVDTSHQLQYLIEENLLLGPSSKVIITSRDRHVLVSGGVQVVHEVKELKMEESLQLFCWHAFKQAYPKMGYENLSAQAIQYARGVPLAIKVLGLYLNSRSTKAWDSALKKFRKYPHMGIHNVLRVSYDGLDVPEQRIFLDIAFFFRGERKEDIIRVLDACNDFYAYCGIDSLQDKALITISRDNKVEIHDLLQEMAEEIVREEAREHPERRSRLNDVNEIQDVLKNSTGTDAIEGITLNPKEFRNHLHLSADAFKKMSNLRFLRISSKLKGGYTVRFPFGLESFSDELRYFCWEEYLLESLPLGFCAEKLVEIHMVCSNVVKLWDGVQDLMNLKTINLSFSSKLKELPDFSMAQNLEILDLRYCKKLRSIHPSLLSLPKLVSLNLAGCCKLKNLHGDTPLKSLKHLTLTGCIALKEFLVASEEMRILHLNNTSIKTLNLQVGWFNKLEELHIGWRLKSFQINELRSLTSLKIFFLSNFTEGIDKSKLLILFDAWHSLEELHLRRCDVGEIPDNINGLSLLKILSLRRCSLSSLPNSIKHLSKLREIDLGECKQYATTTLVSLKSVTQEAQFQRA
ncbi:disease resistance-like protein DSC1 [Neltuma alba]|uniref:disease resistance-like protein DSC1 n=1 Tax=Neltuma alba TaxID=207710 RepID=UPI0010A4C621|nr:disease resistance-like protein DSC1 [Prosopis alba]